MSTCVALHLQTQVASIMEVLAKSAVAEICKAIDEGTAVLRLEMSQSKKENDTLKWRLLEMEKELLEARKGGKNRVITGDRTRLNLQVIDEIRGANSDSYEEERSLSIDSVFGKEWSIGLWKDGELTAKKEEEAPLQPVINEEATQTVEDRQDLFPIKVELFEENLEDSDPQEGLHFRGGLEPERDSTERQYGEEFDPQPASTEVTEEPYTQPTAAGDRLEKAIDREKPFRCNDCGKHYLEKWHLNSHLCSRVGEEPYKCINCGNGFSQEVHLRLHQCSHRREKPYSCVKSTDNSSQKSAFESQQHIYREGNFYSCAACQKSFTNINIFHQHLCNRTGKKLHKCFECGKCFTQSSNLDLHQRTIHRGEKPHSCAECGKNFSQKANLQKHKVIHTGEKPYKCLECGKNFTEKGYLRKHNLIVHRGMKPYRCRECGKCFSQKNSLNSHGHIHRREAILVL